MKLFFKVKKKHFSEKCYLYYLSQSNSSQSQTDDHSYLSLNYAHCAASVMKSALYVDKGGHCLNSKMVPAELLLVAAK